jgi:transcription antitermination factor NusA-like protein
LRLAAYLAAICKKCAEKNTSDVKCHTQRHCHDLISKLAKVNIPEIFSGSIARLQTTMENFSEKIGESWLI